MCEKSHIFNDTNRNNLWIGTPHCSTQARFFRRLNHWNIQFIWLWLLREYAINGMVFVVGGLRSWVWLYPKRNYFDWNLTFNKPESLYFPFGLRNTCRQLLDAIWFYNIFFFCSTYPNISWASHKIECTFLSRRICCHSPGLHWCLILYLCLL